MRSNFKQTIEWNTKNRYSFQTNLMIPNWIRLSLEQSISYRLANIMVQVETKSIFHPNSQVKQQANNLTNKYKRKIL